MSAERERERVDKHKKELIEDLEQKCEKGILAESNFDLLKKLLERADSTSEADAIASLGTTYRATGLHFDKRLEKIGDKIKYLSINRDLSFPPEPGHLTHKLVIGDNYDALLNLSVQYRNSIDIIYIDPPYGKDCMGQFADTNYGNDICRDDLLSMLYPRLLLARDLLKDDGVFYCSVDDRNQAYIKCLLDDVFGEENFYGSLIQKKGNTQNDAKIIQKNHEYILCYVKNFSKRLILSYENETMKPLKEGGYILGTGNGETGNHNRLSERFNLGYTIYLLESERPEEFASLGKQASDFSQKHGDFKSFVSSDGKRFSHAIAAMDYDLEKAKDDDAMEAEVYSDIQELLDAGYSKIRPPKRKGGKLGCWTWGLDLFREYWNKGELEFAEGRKNMKIRRKIPVPETDMVEIDGRKYYLQENVLPLQSIVDIPNSPGTTLLSDDRGILPGCRFSNPKNPEMLKFLFKAYGDKEALILDFFAGSGSTGQAVMDLNREDGGKRRFILCTNNLPKDGFIAETVTAPRLSRIMRGADYDGTDDFGWIRENEPYGDGLEVMDVSEVSEREQGEGKSAFEVIDERLYGKDGFPDIQRKINWVWDNFDNCRKYLCEPQAREKADA